MKKYILWQNMSTEDFVNNCLTIQKQKKNEKTDILLQPYLWIFKLFASMRFWPLIMLQEQLFELQEHMLQNNLE